MDQNQYIIGVPRNLHTILATLSEFVESRTNTRLGHTTSGHANQPRAQAASDRSAYSDSGCATSEGSDDDVGFKSSPQLSGDEESIAGCTDKKSVVATPTRSNKGSASHAFESTPPSTAGGLRRAGSALDSATAIVDDDEGEMTGTCVPNVMLRVRT